MYELKLDGCASRATRQACLFRGDPEELLQSLDVADPRRDARPMNVERLLAYYERIADLPRSSR